MLLGGGGAGVGGWVFKDHPRVQALWTLVTGTPPAERADEDPVGEMAEEIVDRLKPAGSFGQPGTYQVTIRQVHLDPNLFRAGHTVDIQARVLREDGRGRSTTLWDTGPYGERLAVAGKDELIAEWDHQPFQVEWSPGDRLAVEVYDRRAGLLGQPRRFGLAPTPSEPREFPLKPGTFPLRAEPQKPDPRVDPRNVRIVLGSRRVGGLRSEDRDRAPSSTASRPDDRPIVIK
jgi:hypothetical protein